MMNISVNNFSESLLRLSGIPLLFPQGLRRYGVLAKKILEEDLEEKGILEPLLCARVQGERKILDGAFRLSWALKNRASGEGMKVREYKEEISFSKAVVLSLEHNKFQRKFSWVEKARVFAFLEENLSSLHPQWPSILSSLKIASSEYQFDKLRDLARLIEMGFEDFFLEGKIRYDTASILYFWEKKDIEKMVELLSVFYINQNHFHDVSERLDDVRRAHDISVSEMISGVLASLTGINPQQFRFEGFKKFRKIIFQEDFLEGGKKVFEGCV